MFTLRTRIPAILRTAPHPPSHTRLLATRSTSSPQGGDPPPLTHVHEPTSKSTSTSSTVPEPAQEHTADTYSKDVDTTPPDAAIHRVDPGVEVQGAAQEPPSGGEGGERGAGTGKGEGEYDSVSREQPYEMPGKKERYGGLEEQGKEPGKKTSGPEDGPEGKASRGRSG